jgi:hypothetical protein
VLGVTVFILFPHSYGLTVGYQPIFFLIHYTYPFLHSHATFMDNSFLSREKCLPATPAFLPLISFAQIMCCCAALGLCAAPSFPFCLALPFVAWFACIRSCINTVTPKSVTITNLKVGRKAPHKHSWESHFALVRPNRVQTLGYQLAPGSCDSAQGSRRYDSFKTGTPL